MESAVYGAMNASGTEGQNSPNKSLEPTATAVMRPADAGRTPAVDVAHH